MINVAPLPFTRRWLNVTDGELVALDCHVPSGPSEPDLRSSDVYLVLHGLSGGSDEAYVKDFVRKAGSVSCVMVARGMMRTPVLSGKPFHGARTNDVHISAKVRGGDGQTFRTGRDRRCIYRRFLKQPRAARRGSARSWMRRGCLAS